MNNGKKPQYGVRLLCAVAMFSAHSVCAHAAEKTISGLKVQDGQTVAFLGDSITQHGWRQPGGYVKLLTAGLAAEGLEIRAIPAGVSGNTSADMLIRLNQDVISKKPDWMTLSCGINDVWRGIDLPHFKENVTAILDKAQEAGINVILFTATPIGETDNPNNELLVGYNDFLRQIAGERHLLLVDLNTAFWKALQATCSNPGSGPRLTTDGTHMNPLGNVLMAREILACLGVPPARLDAIEQQWRADPSNGFLSCWLIFRETTQVTAGEFEKLQSLASERKMTMEQLTRDLIGQALISRLQAHMQQDDFPINQLLQELSMEFNELISQSTLDKNTTTPAIRPEGNHPGSTVQARLDFGIIATVSIPEFEKLRTIADDRQISTKQLADELCLDAIRLVVKNAPAGRPLNFMQDGDKLEQTYKQVVHDLLADSQNRK